MSTAVSAVTMPASREPRAGVGPVPCSGREHRREVICSGLLPAGPGRRVAGPDPDAGTQKKLSLKAVEITPVSRSRTAPLVITL